jgi:hypothetical protein
VALAASPDDIGTPYFLIQNLLDFQMGKRTARASGEVKSEILHDMNDRSERV